MHDFIKLVLFWSASLWSGGGMHIYCTCTRIDSTCTQYPEAIHTCLHDINNNTSTCMFKFLKIYINSDLPVCKYFFNSIGVFSPNKNHCQLYCTCICVPVFHHSNSIYTGILNLEVCSQLYTFNTSLSTPLFSSQLSKEWMLLNNQPILNLPFETLELYHRPLSLNSPMHW